MIRCIKFRPSEKNTLRGFADLELTHVGLILRDCSLHEKNGKEWVAFPGRPYRGKRRWQPVIEFAEGAGKEREAFQQQALAAIHLAAKGAA